MHELKLFSLNGNRPLAEKIAAEVGLPLSPARVNHFADGEVQIELPESVRGADVYVIQSVSDPVNENFMELMIMVDALRRASAHHINVVISYYGYARADRKARSREPITAKLVANMLEMDGVDQIQGFFDIPVDHLKAHRLIGDYFRKLNLGDNVVVIAPDHSGTKQARALAEELHTPIAIVDKRDQEHIGVIGNVEGMHAIVIDDLIDTGDRIVDSYKALSAAGALDVYAAATHGVFSRGAVDRIKHLGLKKVVITDTIQLDPKHQFEGLDQISVGPMLGKAIKLINSNQSIHVLF